MKSLLKTWEFLLTVLYRDFYFVHQKSFKPSKQTTWNTSRLHGIAWSSGKLDYDKLFAVLSLLLTQK